MLATLQASGPYWDSPGPWHMMGSFGFWWIFPLLMMVFFVALCVFFMTRMPMTRMPWGHSHGSHASSALEILSERFAKGEIPKEEFEEKRAVLVRRV